MARRMKAFAMGALLVAMLLSTTIPLAGCGSTPDESREQPEAADVAQEAPYAFETAGCRIMPERLVTLGPLPDDPNEPTSCALSVLIVESEIPVYVTPFGTVSGFRISLGNGRDSSSASMVRFEPLDGSEGYGARATFYFDSNVRTDEGGKPDELYYGTPQSGTMDTFFLFALEGGGLPFSVGGADWPDGISTLEGLDDGQQTIALDGELVLPSDIYALHRLMGLQVEELFDDCRSKLISSGALEAPGDGSPNGLFVFDDEFNVRFLDGEVAERLTAEPAAGLDGVIFYEGDDVGNPGGGVLLNPFTDEEFLQYPCFYPASYLMDTDTGAFDVPPELADRFADSQDGCRYVVAYLGVISRVDEAYYMGGADRRSVTTLVVVMDLRTREFVHIHVVGTDIPEPVTEVPVGSTMDAEARAYMLGLLG